MPKSGCSVAPTPVVALCVCAVTAPNLEELCLASRDFEHPFPLQAFLVSRCPHVRPTFLLATAVPSLQVQLQLLTGIVKLFLKKPTETQELVQQVLSLATQVGAPTAPLCPAQPSLKQGNFCPRN